MISWTLDEDHIQSINNSGIPATYISKTAQLSMYIQ